MIHSGPEVEVLSRKIEPFSSEVLPKIPENNVLGEEVKANTILVSSETLGGEHSQATRFPAESNVS